LASQQTNTTVASDSLIKPVIRSPRQDSILRARDSIKLHQADSIWWATRKVPLQEKLINTYAGPADSSVPAIIKTYGYRLSEMMARHPVYPLEGVASYKTQWERKPPSTDWIFYLLLGLTFYLAIFRQIFPRYLNELAAVYSHSSVKARQWKEKFHSSQLPSLLLNLFFFMSGGVFLFFMIRYLNEKPAYPEWLQIIACMSFLALLYLGKFIILKFMGLVFDREEAMETYLFIVFLVNKTLGILLLPITLGLVLTGPDGKVVVVTLALILIVLLFVYRYVRSFAVLRNDLKLNALHFFIYLCAFEIVPVALLYKFVLNLFS
jgi:Domain of unknown function (DUF4271)